MSNICSKALDIIFNSNTVKRWTVPFCPCGPLHGTDKVCTSQNVGTNMILCKILDTYTLEPFDL